MPKIVTDADRERMKNKIYDCTINLIREKGIKKVTVDDITLAVGISKGAFYSYYPSREVGLYEVLNRSRAELFTRMEAIMSGELRGKEQLKRFFHEVYLAPDSVILHLPPTELEILLEKLPREYQEGEKAGARDYFQRSFELLQIEERQMEMVALLTDCIGMVATSTFCSEAGKDQAIDVLIDALANYLEEEQ